MPVSQYLINRTTKNLKHRHREEMLCCELFSILSRRKKRYVDWYAEHRGTSVDDDFLSSLHRDVKNEI